MTDDTAPLVLNVDDYDPIRYARTQVLSRGGFRVREAASGIDAVRAAASERPDMILLDVHLPDISGFEVCRRLKADAATASVPIVHVSATSVDERDRVLGLDAGADGYLVEPVSPAMLLATVNALLRARRAEHIAEIARVEAEAANAAKDEFLATLSHELRTPLNTMLGWVQILRTRALDPAEVGRALEVIQRNVQSQAKLIDDLLDVSRIVAGTLTLDVRHVDLTQIVANVVEAAQPAAQKKDVALEVAGRVSSAVVLGDPGRLQQIAGNLVANAVKFTPTGGRVVVSLDLAGADARIVVADTGQGISREFLPHVFDRFRQADTRETRTHGGLGLGLAIVRQLTELHGGTVTAASDGPGKGATFVVRLPLALGAGRPSTDGAR